jgi:hypothetical protein
MAEAVHPTTLLNACTVLKTEGMGGEAMKVFHHFDG